MNHFPILTAGINRLAGVSATQLVRDFDRYIDVCGLPIKPLPETICDRCVLRFNSDGTLSYDRNCTRIDWVAKCDVLSPPTEGPFIDRPGITCCDWEANVSTFKEACILPLPRLFP